MSVIVLLVGWPRRRGIGGWYFIGYCITLIIWTAGASVESLVPELETKVFWSQVLYIGFVQVIPFLLLFVVSYSRQRSVPLPTALLLFVLPFITLGIAWIRPFQVWLWSGFSAVSPDTNLAIYYHGPWFWVHTIYIYSLLFIGLGFLIKNIAAASPLFRLQLTPILIGILFPAITGTLYTFDLLPVKGMDITPTGFAITGLFFVWCLVRYRILDIVPVARTTLVEQLQEGVIVLDVKDNIVDINKSAGKMFNLIPRSVLGSHYQSVIPSLGEIETHSGDDSQREIHPAGPGGSVLEIKTTKLLSPGKQVNGMILVIRDVTARKLTETKLQAANARLHDQLQEIRQLHGKLEHQALHDSLTGLYNRHIFEILEKELSSAKRESKAVSLAIIDVDHFKTINDKYGHQQGDMLLQALSTSLSAKIREEDYAARYGGDEIILFFPGMQIQDAVKKAEEIRADFERIAFSSEDQPLKTTVTIGLAAFPQHGEKIDELFRAADRALYLAKKAGRNRVRAA